VTLLFGKKLALQALPQLMPKVKLSITPVPVPLLATERAKAGIPLKLALTVFEAVNVKVQVVNGLLQSPLQPVKVEPGSATAVRVTMLPG